MHYTVYVLWSDTLKKRYVGVTSKDVKERLKDHNLGSNSFTRNGVPWKRLYFEQNYCKHCVMNRESFFKSGQGRKILDKIVSKK